MSGFPLPKKILNSRLKSENLGFTLVELLVVISIITVLSTAGLNLYTSALASSRDSQRKADLKQVQSALAQFHNDAGFYPNSLDFTNGSGITNPSNNNIYLAVLPRDPLYTTDPATYIY